MSLDSLPNNIAEEILGRLPIQEAVRTSVLSRGWRCRWQSITRLTFDATSFRPRLGETNLDFQRRLVKAIDRVLLLHIGPIREFKLSVHDAENLADVTVWLQVLSRKGVKTLGLRFVQRFPYKLPPYLFDCELLNRMELHSCILNLPESFKGFKYLITLHLAQLTISTADLRCLISGCPLLEELRLSQCQGYDVTICAPNLRKLTLEGCFLRLHLESTPVLTAASICLSTLSSMHMLHTVNGGGTRGLAGLCCAFPRIESLEIAGHFLSILSSAGEVPETLPQTPIRLKSLTMDINLENSKECEATLCMIRSCCSLKILKLNHQRRPFAQAGTGAGAELVWKERTGIDEFDELTTVMITGVAGSGSALAFVRLLLAGAANLVTVDIGVDKEVLDDVSKLKDLAIDLLSCPRASKQARIFMCF